MASRWSKAEDSALVNAIGDGVPMNTVLQAVQAVAANGSQPKTLGAVRTRARNKTLGLDYRGSDVDGLFHKGVSRRKHGKTDDAEIAPTITTSSKPETINTESGEIIAKNSNNDAVIATYSAISALIMSENYTSVEISAITSDGLKVTISKDSI